MKLVVFGLSISSTWGNGHATLWRALCKALGARGHLTVFYEHDTPYYAGARDMTAIPGCELRLYSSWPEVAENARREIADADVAMITSYCADAVAACDLVLNSRAHVRCFYDLDAPVTLARLRRGDAVEYLPLYGLKDFELVLSYTGGAALDLLREWVGARHVAPLYGSVDPDVHKPAAPLPEFAGDLSYLGTYATDRQAALERLLVEPARMRSDMRFLIGGAQYPQDFPWTSNIYFVRHLPPAQHPAFYCSGRATLNVTRAAMAELGYCPSGRLFEAAACGVPILSDIWEGLDQFYSAGQILPCSDSTDVLKALSLSDYELRQIGVAARERTLDEHTAMHRAIEFERLIETRMETEPRPKANAHGTEPRPEGAVLSA
jgi:spore maturation protein CgeB